MISVQVQVIRYIYHMSLTWKVGKQSLKITCLSRKIMFCIFEHKSQAFSLDNGHLASQTMEETFIDSFCRSYPIAQLLDTSRFKNNSTQRPKRAWETVGTHNELFTSCVVLPLLPSPLTLHTSLCCQGNLTATWWGWHLEPWRLKAVRTVVRAQH